MSALDFKPATRKGVKPLIGLYAESGRGKTFSGLLLARGIAGPNGKIGMIDTESGRGSLYADVIPGGYDTMELSSFGPQNYIEAIGAAERAGFDVLVIDSMSHEWEGIGGVLDMAGENESRSGKPGLHNWKAPKLAHQKLVLRLLQSKLVIICCLRAKYKSRQVKENGRTAIVKDDHTSPIQAEDFIFEMTAHLEILEDHTIHLSKCSHPDLRACFPADGKEPIAIKHGEAIARWAANPSANRQPDVKALKKRLFEVTTPIHQGKAETMVQWLRSQKAIGPDEDISNATPERLTEIIEAAKSKLPTDLL